MKNNSVKPLCIIESSYLTYCRQVLSYISSRINNMDDAEDLTHDTFLRLMEYKPMLNMETVKYFIFTIARNLVIDYLRRYYKYKEVSSYMYETSPSYVESPESGVISEDILKIEKLRISTLPTQRKTIYNMSRFDEKTTSEISAALNLSVRTVENHLFIGRKEIRKFIRQCI